MYELHRNPPGGPCVRTGRYATLTAAMDVPRRQPGPYCGTGGPLDWCAVPGIPTKIYLDAAAYLPANDNGSDMPPPPWIIEKPGVARELAALMTADQLARRQWSTRDKQWLAVAAALGGPTRALADAQALELILSIARRLAAWYATSDAIPGDLFLASSDLEEIVRLALRETGANRRLQWGPAEIQETVGMLAACASQRGLRIVPDPVAATA
jgi:hypothetical protein